MVTIISTHSVSKNYILWETNTQEHSAIPVWDCTIPGGAGVFNRHSLHTPEGVATEISDEALEKLKMIPAFVNDVNDGYIKILKGKKARTVDADAEAEKDMNTEGSGRQLTAEELEKDGAVVNSDGSIDVTKGGKNAAVAHAAKGEKGKRSLSGRRANK